MSNGLQTPVPDKQAMIAALAAMFDPADVVEIRAFHKGKKRTDAGYFDGEHRGELVEAAARLNTAGAAVYVVMNPIDPQLLGRYCNRVQDYAPATATDANVVRRRWLLLDFDPVRPKETSATEEQLKAAHERARACAKHLKGAGWPDPLAGQSGNGWHLLYPLDLPNNDESRDLVKGVLAGLAERFNDGLILVDQAVFNAARITKLYGTVANKGDHTQATPWRLSYLKSIPKRGPVVTPEQLRVQHPAKITAHPSRPVVSAGARGDFDLPAFLSRLGIEYDQDTHEGSTRFKLAHCPFNPEHGKGEAAIFLQASGALGFKCQHNSCSDKHWQDVRALIDGPKDARRGPVAGYSRPTGAEYQSGTGNAAAGEYASTVDLIRGSDVTPEAVSWLWGGWLAAGKMHILGGAPGTGKTTISLALAATVTTGGRWPDGSRSPIGNVVMWSGEDDPADTLVPRLALSGADLSRVYFIADVREGNERRSFDPARDMEVLQRKLLEVCDVRLLIVDPIVSAIAGDSHKNAEVRRGLQPLVDLAVSMRCALLGITHFSKGTGGREPVERLTGSLAFGALARVVLVAAKHQEEGEDGKSKRLFIRAKSNIGPDDGGFEYDLPQAELKTHPGIFASSVLWGDAVEGAARELLATADATDDGDGESMATVANWLDDLLTEEGGRLDRRDVMRAAHSMGHKERTVHRAREKLNLKVEQTGFGKDKRSVWISANSGIRASIVPILPNKLLGTHGTIDGTHEGGSTVEVEV